MEISIYRPHQIGGCITEIATDTTRILIDLGHNLPKGNQPAYDELADNPGSLTELLEGVNAIFYTHYHGDHVDLFAKVPDEIPQYIGETAKRVMLCKYKRLTKTDTGITLADVEKLEKFQTYHVLQPITIGDIRITPFFTSHSACDAYMFLIEAEGQRILHTGDFREHGYLGKGLVPTIKKHIGQVDVLITEGTMLSRTHEKVKTENDLKLEAIQLMRLYKYVFVLCSSTDIDRLATFYQASKEAQHSFVCDDYQKEVLQIFTETSGTHTDLYQFNNVYFYKQGHAEQFELLKKRGFCMPVRGSSEKFINMIQELQSKLPAKQTLFIYSAWDGYLDNVDTQNKNYLTLWNLFDKSPRERLHTSGHATPETLAKVCCLTNPTTAIIPIHSEASEGLKQLPIFEELKSKIVSQEEVSNPTHSTIKGGILISLWDSYEDKLKCDT